MCGSEMVKTFCATSTCSDIDLLTCLTKMKVPSGRTYIENISGLISHKKEPVLMVDSFFMDEKAYHVLRTALQAEIFGCC